MVEWCPKCNGQLPPGLEVCPRCGAQLRKPGKDTPEVSGKDIAWITGYTLMFMLIPLVIIVVVGLLCVFLAR